MATGSTVRLPMKFAVRPLDDSAPSPAMILRGPVAMAVRSTGGNPGDLLREPDLERSLVASAGEPLTYRPRSGADLLVRPFYAFKQDERYSLYLDPNRHSHREARFIGRRLARVGGLPLRRPPGRLGRVRVPRDGRPLDRLPLRRRRHRRGPHRRPAGRPRSTSTLPAATSRSSGARRSFPAGEHRITITDRRVEARSLEGPIHQHRRIRGDAMTLPVLEGCFVCGDNGRQAEPVPSGRSTAPFERSRPFEDARPPFEEAHPRRVIPFEVTVSIFEALGRCVRASCEPSCKRDVRGLEAWTRSHQLALARRLLVHPLRVDSGESRDQRTGHRTRTKRGQYRRASWATCQKSNELAT